MKSMILLAGLMLIVGCFPSKLQSYAAGRGGEEERHSLRDWRERRGLDDVHFAFDSSALFPEAQGKFRQNARIIETKLFRHVLIEGHCDERGTNEYNMALGERRARSAKNFLRTLGIPPPIDWRPSAARKRSRSIRDTMRRPGQRTDARTLCRSRSVVCPARLNFTV